MKVTMEEIVSFSKRRGFIYPSSEIYGGFSAAYDFGPLGVELIRNVQNSWWKAMVHDRTDVWGMDSAIFMNPKVWEASGHTEHFTDPLMDCKSCKKRHRADKLIEDKLRKENKPIDDIKFTDKNELKKLIEKLKIKCPDCGKQDWTDIRDFNTLFETYQGVIKGNKDVIYLRGEIAQGMFVQYKNILGTMHPTLPFGIAQSGKAFRNEITPKNFIFRTREFNLMEVEYFVDPKNAMDHFEKWKKATWDWVVSLGISEKNLRWREQSDEERAHYSSKTFDLEYRFPWGFDEIGAVANRTDYDLSNHQKKSGEDLTYFDQETGKRFIPHVIEPTYGSTRIMLAVMVEAYMKEKLKKGERTIMKFDKDVAPVKIAIFPLVRKKEFVDYAKKIFDELKNTYLCVYDETQSIGKRYRRHDEIGTPFCITVDTETLEKDTVTIRDRDSMKQERIEVKKLKEFFDKKLN